MGFSFATKLIVAYVGIFVLLCFVENSNQQGFMNCKKFLLQVAKKQLKIVSLCTKEMRAKNISILQIQERFSCIIKCALDKAGLLDAKKQVTNVTIQSFFDQYVPEDYHETGHVLAESCVEEFSPLMNDKDEQCIAYGNFIKCIQNYVSELCG